MPLDDAVRADDELIERLRTGGRPPSPADPLWTHLAAWRDFARDQPADLPLSTRGERVVALREQCPPT